jgi:HEPN domain-containing protein
LDTTPPFSHNLVYLAEKAALELSEDNLEFLEEVSDYNLEARYPDDKLSFNKKCTAEFTEKKLKQIEEVKKWLLLQFQ